MNKKEAKNRVKDEKLEKRGNVMVLARHLRGHKAHQT